MGFQWVGDMSEAGGLVWVPARQVPAALALRGPGQLGRDGAEGILIFNASQGGRGRDLLALFYQEEVGGLDWLDDYLRDAGMTNLVRNLQAPPDEAEEEEDMYYKNMVTSVEPDEV